MAIRKISWLAALLAALILGVCGGASVQQKITTKFGWITPDNPQDFYTYLIRKEHQPSMVWAGKRHQMHMT